MCVSKTPLETLLIYLTFCYIHIFPAPVENAAPLKRRLIDITGILEKQNYSYGTITLEYKYAVK